MKRYIVRHSSGDFVRLVNQPAGDHDQLAPLFVRYREDATIFETPQTARLSIFGDVEVPADFQIIEAVVTIRFDDSDAQQDRKVAIDDASEYWNVVGVQYEHDYIAEADVKAVAHDDGTEFVSCRKMTSTELALRIKTGQLVDSKTGFVYLGEHAYKPVTANLVKGVVKANRDTLFVFDNSARKLAGRTPVFPAGSYNGYVETTVTELVGDADC